MPPALAFLSRSLSPTGSGARPRAASALAWALLAALHLAALAVLIWSETDLVSRLAFVLAWGLLNFVLLVALRRPMPAAALTLVAFAILVLLSRFKHDVLLMTVNFLDIMIVDSDTISFLLTIYPNLGWTIGAVAAAVLPAVALLWWLDLFRVRLPVALLGSAICVAALSALALAVPNDLYDEFTNTNYVSKFARSGVTGTVDLFSRGYLESDATVTERLSAAAGDTCRAAARPPHIVMVFDESSFDISRIPGIKVAPGYQSHFRSFDGK